MSSREGKLERRYGRENDYTNSCPQNFKFTGKERDPETGLDNFGARYYASSYARFMSPDPGHADAVLDNPQSWDAYSYVMDNPETLTDPSGTAACGQKDMSGCQNEIDLVAVAWAMAHPGLGSSTAQQQNSRLQHLIGFGKGLANLVGFHLHPANADQRSGMLEVGVDLAFTPMPLEVVGEAADAMNAAKLGKDLASEEQMVEVGTRIAGAGTQDPLRIAQQLARDYGGEPGDWAKMSSSARDFPDGTHVETHWYENVVTGQRVKFAAIIHPEIKP